MNIKREEMKKNVEQVERLLSDLVYGDNKTIQVNVRHGLLAEKRFNVLLSKQMTLDAYVDNNEANAVTSFPVLDVTINRRAFLEKWLNPNSLAIMIHNAARKLPEYEIK